MSDYAWREINGIPFIAVRVPDAPDRFILSLRPVVNLRSDAADKPNQNCSGWVAHDETPSSPHSGRITATQSRFRYNCLWSSPKPTTNRSGISKHE